MDTSKQPGICFDEVLLAECSFKRIPKFTFEDLELTPSFQYEHSVQDETAQAILSLELIVKNQENELVLSLGCTFVGIFSVVHEHFNMDMDHFLKFNAPALLFPFIRQFVHNITIQSGIEPIILPPTNVVALINGQE